MKENTSLALIGEEPALATVLQEYAASVTPALLFKAVREAAAAQGSTLTIFYAEDACAREAQLKTVRQWKNEAPQNVCLLVLGEDVPEPEEEAAPLGLAGIFRKPLRLAALLDAGFSALRLSELKSARKLSKDIRFDPFTRTLEDTLHQTSQTLTPKEADLLLALLEAGEKGLSRETALTRIWGYHREVDSHAVETAAWRLRRKLEALLGAAGGLESRDGVYFLKT